MEQITRINLIIIIDHIDKEFNKHMTNDKSFNGYLQTKRLK